MSWEKGRSKLKTMTETSQSQILFMFTDIINPLFSSLWSTVGDQMKGGELGPGRRDRGRRGARDKRIEVN